MQSQPHPHYQNLYTILGLPTPTLTSAPSSRSSQNLTTTQIKAAYRRALLNHHPDKAAGAIPNLQHAPSWNPTTPTFTPSKNGKPSIDAITHARNTLSNPSSRRAYDTQLVLSAHRENASTSGSQAHVGGQIYSETIDLDDMLYAEEPTPSSEGEQGEDEHGAVWTKECRCGNEEGFVLSEGDLLGALELSRVSNGLDGAAVGTPALDEGRGEVLVGCRGCSLVIRVLFWAVDEEEQALRVDESSGGLNGDGDAHGEMGRLRTVDTGTAATATTV